jgi:GTP-binding protein Era
MAETYRSGIIALIGRPNVGKSTLFNRLVGTKLSIISKRPQTTRHRILGIKTDVDTQWVYADTPGVDSIPRSGVNRYVKRAAGHSIQTADCVVLIITAQGWRAGDENALALARQHSGPVVLAVNMIDRCRDRRDLLPLISQSAAKMNFAEIVPLSAKSGDNVSELEKILRRYLPEQPAIYPADRITDRNERFIAAELVREQIFRRFNQEVPYSTRIAIDRFQEQKNTLFIDAAIWVERQGHKPIMIGKEGARLKLIGTHARLAMESFFSSKVQLKLWVKVRKIGADKGRVQRRPGFPEEN